MYFACVDMKNPYIVFSRPMLQAESVRTFPLKHPGGKMIQSIVPLGRPNARVLSFLEKRPSAPSISLTSM